MTCILNPKFNAVVHRLGSQVPHILTESDYPDFAAMQADYASTGRIQINTLNSDNTIFGSPELNYEFRAWHDFCHILANADFSDAGERRTADMMRFTLQVCVPDLSNADYQEFSRIIDAEVIGQAAYYFKYGKFPVNQYEFTKRYLATGGEI